MQYFKWGHVRVQRYHNIIIDFANGFNQKSGNQLPYHKIFIKICRLDRRTNPILVEKKLTNSSAYLKYKL